MNTTTPNCEIAQQLSDMEAEARAKAKANPALTDRYGFCAGEFLKARHRHADNCTICLAAEAAQLRRAA